MKLNHIKMTWIMVLLIAVAIQMPLHGKTPYDLDEVLNIEDFKPHGESYEATVPETLDLAEVAKLSLNALVGNMDADQSYGVYQGFWLNKDKPAHPFALTWNITVKNVRTIPAMRVMCGSEFGVEEEYGAVRALMSEIRNDGNMYYPLHCQGPPKGTSYPQTNASMMFVMLARQGLDGNPAWDQWFNLLAQGLQENAILVEDRAFYPMQAGIDPHGEWHIMNTGGDPPYEKSKRPFDYDPEKEPESDAMGYEGAAKAEANRAMSALAKHYMRTGDQKSLDIAQRIYRFSMKPAMWWENSDEKRYPGYEHGIWMGHFHNGTQGLLGLLDMAKATGSDWQKEFCREFYENIRRNGIVRLGWFPCWSAPERNGDRPANLAELTEPCALGDFIVDAVMMSDAGLGDYWDDVDYTVRNHLLEQQIVDLDQMRRITDIEAGSERDAMLKRFRGGFMGCTLTRGYQKNTAGCCTVNGAQGYYYAWHGITRFKDGIATVNLFLNRASRHMDIDSYLPYEGKVVLHNKLAKTALVRIPSWLDRETVSYRIQRKGNFGFGKKEIEVQPPRFGNRVILEDLKPGDKITLEFPVPEWTDRYTMNKKVYTVKFRGSTVMEIGPREDDNPDIEYILYQRDHLKGDKAPMHEVTRFVSDKLVPPVIF
jgi:hypothetical protein